MVILSLGGARSGRDLNCQSALITGRAESPTVSANQSVSERILWDLAMSAGFVSYLFVHFWVWYILESEQAKEAEIFVGAYRYLMGNRWPVVDDWFSTQNNMRSGLVISSSTQ